MITIVCTYFTHLSMNQKKIPGPAACIAAQEL